jgi:hypothetical protein
VTLTNFNPFVTYDPDGDCIEFYGEPGSVRAERVDDMLTVYYGQETGQLVGCRIKRLQSLIKDSTPPEPIKRGCYVQ